MARIPEPRAEQVGTGPYGIEHLLAESREKLARVSPQEAFEIQRDGGLIIDIRPESDRLTDGVIPGALTVERIVLEWRLDPAGSHRLTGLHPQRPVVLVCNEGYASSLAAAQAQELGLTKATDLAGGFRAWKEQGLPTTAAVT